MAASCLSRGLARSWGPAAEILRGADDPHQALRQLQREHKPELLPALQWARASTMPGSRC